MTGGDELGAEYDMPSEAADGQESAAARPPVSRAARIGTAALIVLLTLLYAYHVASAMLNAIGVVTQINAYNVFAAENGLNEADIPWVLLVVNVLVAPIAFAIAARLGYRRRAAERLLLLVVGLAATAAITLSLAAFA